MMLPGIVIPTFKNFESPFVMYVSTGCEVITAVRTTSEAMLEVTEAVVPLYILVTTTL